MIYIKLEVLEMKTTLFAVSGNLWNISCVFVCYNPPDPSSLGGNLNAVFAVRHLSSMFQQSAFTP